MAGRPPPMQFFNPANPSQPNMAVQPGTGFNSSGQKGMGPPPPRGYQPGKGGGYNAPMGQRGPPQPSPMQIPPGTSSSNVQFHNVAPRGNTSMQPGSHGGVPPTAAMSSMSLNNFPKQGLPNSGIDQNGPQSRMPENPANVGHPASLPTSVEIDPSSQAERRFVRCSMDKFPKSNGQLGRCGVPMGAVIRPLAPDENGEDKIEVVDFGSCGIIRCKRCRTYINPFVQWMDNGRRWRCNMCSMLNDVPSAYYCHLDNNGQRTDKMQRPELCNGSVELVAPSEYMVRPPVSPVYFFVVDVSVNSVGSGMLQTCVDTIKDNLSKLPGSPRTQVGFITFDSTVHFYNLKSSLNAPQMLVVSELEDLFLPLPEDLLVNLSESMDVVLSLLDSLPTMFQNTKNVESCFGAAIDGAFRVMGHIGGKMCVFQTNLPVLGPGQLKPRENNKILGTETEHNLFAPSSVYYENKAAEFARQQIAVDLFLFSPQYTDVATLGSLTKLTGGQLHYYPGFTAQVSSEKFSKELSHCLTRTTGFEGVMRVRCTKGMAPKKMYGNYITRGRDLLGLPNCSSDSALTVEFAHDEEMLSSPVIYIQAALLYTTSSFSRRIRVHTVAVPVTTVSMDCYQFADVDTACNILSKHAIEIAKRSGLSSARKYLQGKCIDTIQSYKNAVMSQPASSQQNPNDPNDFLPSNLQLLPLYIMSLQKNITFRGGVDIRPDERMFMIHQLNGMSVNQSRVFVYPNLYALHSMTSECGKPIEVSKNDADAVHVAGKRNILLPPTQKLRAEVLESNGIYLLEDSVSMYIWIGKSASSELLQMLFGAPHENIDCRQLSLQDLGTNFSSRVNNIVNAIREERSSFPRLIFLKEGDHAEARFFMHLVEERANFADCCQSYPEYLSMVTRKSAAPTQGKNKGGKGATPYHSGGAPTSLQAPRGMVGATPGKGVPVGARGPPAASQVHGVAPPPRMQKGARGMPPSMSNQFGGPTGTKGLKGKGGMPHPPQMPGSAQTRPPPQQFGGPPPGGVPPSHYKY